MKDKKGMKDKKRSTSRPPPRAGQTDKPDHRGRVESRPPEGAADKEAPSFGIVGIGASAGGLEAFTRLLKHLSHDTGLGFVLVQHLDPEHDSALTQILARATSMPVREVTNNLRVEANHVYIIPPNANLSIEQGRLTLQPRRQTGRPQRVIDVFFESLAQDQRERAVGVILSGTASDGTQGLEAIKAEGGLTFAQDESAKYDSMPRSAVAAGCVDFMLSPENIAKELGPIAKHPYVAGRALTPALSPSDRERGYESDSSSSEGERGSETSRGETPLPSRSAANGFKKILLLLRNHAGVDFSLYKQTTIQRRITRRMVLNKLTSLESYANFLRGNAKELDALYSDALISVTSFFRNPEAFDALTHIVFPTLLQQREDEPVRVWVLGCSTGQEAYSIAMAFAESAEKASRLRKLRVFATDLNDALLEKARHGLYAKSLAQELSPERLRRFFTEEDGGYRINKPLREMVVFARQNLINDPPFSRMDLITCRNLLIYLEPSLQKKAMSTFHYALKPKGFLLLGASESIGAFTDLFEPADKKHKLYSKKASPTPAFHLPVKKERDERLSPGLRPPSPHQTGRGKSEGWKGEGSEVIRGELNAQREADRVIINQFAPPGVLISADLQVLQFRGPTGAYLEPPRGKATFDVLKMARGGLMLPLRAVINKAKKSNSTARRDHVRVQQNGKTRTVNLKVIPLKHVRERCFLIMFEDATKGGTRRVVNSRSGAGQTPRRTGTKEESRHISDLETDLAETRDYLQSMQEQHEAANEELQASNEEVQSANEELQSVNEELETSKEELESANEELTTVNEEMANRNTELSRLNSDLINLQTSTRLAIVLLGRNLTIRRFSVQAEKHFDLLATDVGRPIGNIRHNLVFEERRSKTGFASAVPPHQHIEEPQAGWQVKQSERRAPDAADYPSDLETFIADVIAAVREREREVRDMDGRRYSLRVRPYFTLDDKVDGAVLVLVDITDLKRSEQTIAAAREYAETIIETMREPLLVLDGQLRVESANRSFYRTFRVAPAETIGKTLYELGNGQWNIPQLRTLLQDILPQNNIMNDFQVEHTFEHLGRRSMLLNARRMDNPTGTTQRILLAIEDITERRQAEAAQTRLAAIIESSDDAIVSQDMDGVIASWNVGAEWLFGYMAQEAVGRPVSMLIPPDREDEEPRILERISRGESIEHYETVRRCKNGSTVEVSLTVSPIRDTQGRITGVSKIYRNITVRKGRETVLHRLTEELEARVDERTGELVVSQERLRALAVELNLTEQRERQRLATDLHDYLAQLLALSKIKLGQVKQQPMVPPVTKAVTEVQEVLDQALTYTRTLVAQLSPPMLNEFGLSMALKWLVEQMQRQDLTVSLAFEGRPLVLAKDQATLLFQSVRELLLNVVKHAETNQARIRGDTGGWDSAHRCLGSRCRLRSCCSSIGDPVNTTFRIVQHWGAHDGARRSGSISNRRLDKGRRPRLCCRLTPQAPTVRRDEF